MECALSPGAQQSVEFRTVTDWDIDSPEAALLERAIARLLARKATLPGSSLPSVMDRLGDGAAVLRVGYMNQQPKALYVLGFEGECGCVMAAYSELSQEATTQVLRLAVSEINNVAKYVGLKSITFYSNRKAWRKTAACLGFRMVGVGKYEREVEV